MRYCIVYLAKEQTRINNQIRVQEVRLIDSEGNNLGVVKTNDAIKRAQNAGLDLIELSSKTNPPVAKITDYGKYKYDEERKAKQSKKPHTSEMREIRVGLGTSERDLEMKAKKASEFLAGGDRIKVEMKLKGREKYLDKNFIAERLKRVLQFITVSHKVVEEPKKGGRGIHMVIEKEK